MKKMIFVLAALLGMGAMCMTSCSDDAVTNDGDGGVPMTKANNPAYKMQTMTLDRDGNVEQMTFTYNADELSQLVAVKDGITKTAVYTYLPGQVKVVCDDPTMGEVIRYTYTLNADGMVTQGRSSYDSDDYEIGIMQFAYNATRQLTTISQSDGNGGYEEVCALTYAGRPANYATVSLGGVVATCTVSGLENNACFDLNLYNMLGLDELYTYAVFGDLFPNTPKLVSQVAVAGTANLTAYTYTQAAADAKTTACAITSTREDEDDNGNPIQITSVTNATYGY